MRRSPTSVKVPQAGRRWMSSASTGAKTGILRKGEPTPVTDVEIVKQRVRRMRKAETDERMDLSAHLTEVKTYMGGFTRPRDIRASNWFNGGRYRSLGKKYENPPPLAYTPHTVFVAESRHIITYAAGRPDAHEYIIGVCQEGHLPAVLAQLNSRGGSRLEPKAVACMDNARWPWLPAKREKAVKWWKPGENPKEILQAIAEGKEVDFDVKEVDLSASAPQQSTTSSASASASQLRGFHTSARDGARVFILSPRTLHSSATVSDSRPKPKTSDDHARDGTVPEYYVERKKKRDTIEERQELDDSLMHELDAGIISDEIAASTRRPTNKIPTEFKADDGTIVHPSGFTVPEPGEAPVRMADLRERDSTVETAGVIERVHEEDYTGVQAIVRPHTHKVPAEVGEADGHIRHPSGFEPPTPANKFPAASITPPVHDPSPRPYSERPKPKTSDDHARDGTVPEYYVVHKKQRKAVPDGGELEGSLMQQLDASILSSAIATSTRRPANKIPVEFNAEDGTIVHPSGFTVPTPGKAPVRVADLRERDPSTETAGVVERVSEEDYDGVAARVRPHIHKVPAEVAEADGAIRHPSGFEPPTPAHEFPASTPEENVPLQATTPEEPSTLSTAASLKTGPIRRGFHSSSFVSASEVSMPTSPSALRHEDSEATKLVDRRQKAPDDENYVTNVRKKYEPLLKTEPFWRPLLTVTLSTRPLALSLERLCKGLARGIPFVASVSLDDRKIAKSMDERMRNMRIQRMNELVMGIADGLAGHKGGFIGIRFSNNERGRGVDGSLLSDPIPYQHRSIQVGVGNWYRRKEDVKELFSEGAKTHTHPWLETFDLDERGNRLDNDGRIVPWRKAEPFEKLKPNELLPESLALQEGEVVFSKKMEQWTPHASQHDAGVASGAQSAEVSTEEDDADREFEADLASEGEEAEADQQQEKTTFRFHAPTSRKPIEDDGKAGRAAVALRNRRRNLRQAYLARNHADVLVRIIAQHHNSVLTPFGSESLL